MTIKVTSESNLDAVLARLAAVPAGLDKVIEEGLGEVAIGFMEDLTGFGAKIEGGKIRRQLAFPGNGIWPVGARFKPIRRNRYVPHDGASSSIPSGAQESGRSINAWRMQLKGTTLKLINNARVRRKLYAQHAHKVGDAPGTAIRQAEAAWEDRTEEGARAIGAAVAKMMRGPNG